MLIQLTDGQTAFVRLISMFACKIDNIGPLQLALVQPYMADFKLTCIKAIHRSVSISIPVESIIRGALLYPDPENHDEFLVVDHVDRDIFLCMRDWKHAQN
ncbi:hypothetical protein PAXRUDRAFT_36699 [Paxillus rubicundulus Ve08.2h10]|uniref:Uncharacterized protein n=1 Tax=Paxillus rubicundulus Ve08.2h10 TaxID=930991 RepID=A0A0D0DJ03_9AGAM|nr:hypothetical protein PAXRUDRAFT_36699 [Paxillus rubicundulus Ve08.2h10]